MNTAANRFAVVCAEWFDGECRHAGGPTTMKIVGGRLVGIADGDRIQIGNRRGQVILHAEFFEGVQRGVTISEGIWANSAFEGGEGINTLTSADAIAPHGGAAFHDVKIWVRKL